MSELDLELRKRIEQAYLAQQDEIRRGLSDYPTGDQLLMGTVTPDDRELTYDEVDYLLRSMLFRLNELRDQPRILYVASFNRFLNFLFKHSNVEVYILVDMSMNLNETRIERTPLYERFEQAIEEFR